MRTVLLKPEGHDEPIEVGIEPTGDDASCRVRLGDDTTPFDVEVEPASDTCGWLRMEGRIVPFWAIRRDGSVTVWVRGRSYTVELVERTARRAVEGGAATGNAELTAPMPGTILKINAVAGGAFDAHEPLIVLESMKMEMTLSAPQPGRVRDVLCQEGELVEMGEILARLEPPE